jgi:hypothetical protein
MLRLSAQDMVLEKPDSCAAAHPFCKHVYPFICCISDNVPEVWEGSVVHYSK